MHIINLAGGMIQSVPHHLKLQFKPYQDVPLTRYGNVIIAATILFVFFSTELIERCSHKITFIILNLMSPTCRLRLLLFNYIISMPAQIRNSVVLTLQAMADVRVLVILWKKKTLKKAKKILLVQDNKIITGNCQRPEITIQSVCIL